jgi:ribonuclease HI
LDTNNREDILCWQGTKDGYYTVKSGYHAQVEWNYQQTHQAQTSNPLREEQTWKKLWKIDVPPKQIHLLWRIIHEALHVKTNLLHKGILCDTLCPICTKPMETITHPFLQCDWAKMIWYSSPISIKTTEIQTTTFSEWILYMLKNTNQECMQIIASITYSMWYARNQMVFQNKDIPVEDTVKNALKALHDYHRHRTQNRLKKAHPSPSFDRNKISWNPPPRNFLKLNVDAHLHGDGRWAYGMVLRRSDGRCLGAATRICNGNTDAAMAEVTGLQEALKLIESHQLTNIIIELDANQVVSAIKKKKFPNNCWGQIACVFSRVLEQREDIFVSWVSRRGNQVAHNLARWAIYEPNKFWAMNFPTCILTHIQIDMGNVSI